MNEITKKIQETYHARTVLLLAGYPKELAAFEKAWAEGEMRRAYVVVDDAIRSHGLTPANEFRKIDEDFYGEFVN